MKTLTLTLFLLTITLFPFAQNIVQVEYFFDLDKGIGQNTLIDVAVASDGDFPFTANTSALPAGFHNMFIRTKSSDGKWSLTSKRTIEVLPSQAIKKITLGEYFIDVDPGFGAAAPIDITTQDSAILQNFTASVTGLKPGFHKLYGRLKDNNGYWSQTFMRTIEVTNPATAIVSGEYFFDTDPGFGLAEAFTFANPSTDSVYTFNVPLNKIPAGAARIYVRVKDNGNLNWSLTTSQVAGVVTSIKSGMWGDVATWSNNKIPDINTVVLLKHNVTVNVNANCKSIATTGPALNINPGMQLNITGK